MRLSLIPALAGILMVPPNATPAAAQSLLDRTPNLGGTWVGERGTLHFHFLHRFEATEAPTRKVVNTPTFLLALGLPGSMVGARYATSSLVASGFPNEWEFFARVRPLQQSGGSPVDMAVHAGYNQATSGVDGELTIARELGRVRLLGAARGFSDAYRSGDARFALAGGASVRLTQFVAVSADVAGLTDRAATEDLAWSGGLQVQIPTTPHTVSLHASNANTTTLEGASVGVAGVRYGFEFTVPVTLSRYFGRRSAEPEVVASSADTVVVTMDNRLTFSPGALRIRSGQTVLWRNASALPHTVTADPTKAAKPASVALPEGAKPFDSGDIAPGAVFSHTFTVPGQYKYFCIPHELADMVGTVTVVR